MLYENRNLAEIDSLYIPIKIICTDKDYIKSAITRATNNQTAVTKEELEALTDFQRKLEDFYVALDLGLVYERRTNQYKNSSVVHNSVVSIEIQVKVFASMVLDSPHIVSGNYGKLLKDYKSDIFVDEHNLLPYYVSALIYSKLLNLFDDLRIHDTYWRYRYYLIMLYKYIVTESMLPSLFKKKPLDKYCNMLIESVKDEEEILSVFNTAIEILNSNDLDLSNRKLQELKSTTDKLKDYVRQNFFKKKKDEKITIEVDDCLISSEKDVPIKNVARQLTLFEL